MAVRESGAGKIAGADPGECKAIALNAPGLGMENAGDRQIYAAEQAGLDSRCAAGKIEQSVKGIGSSEMEIVAGEQADGGTGACGGEERGRQQLDARALREGDEDGNLAGADKNGEQVIEERIVRPGDKGAFWLLPAGQVAGITAVAWDDVDVDMGNCLICGRICVEADTVAVRMMKIIQKGSHLRDKGEQG